MDVEIEEDVDDMAKEKFDRSKPHVNVGTIGHIDHGKTTLTAALTKVAADKGWAKFVPYDEVAKASESQGRRDDTKILTIASSHVEYATGNRHCRHGGCPGDGGCLRNLITAPPEREVDKPLMMPIEDVFSISGRGTVVTGRIERGKVKVGEEIEIVGFKATEKKVVTGVEMFRKLLDEGVAGDNVGVLLRGVEKTDDERGQVLAKPGSIKPHTKFKGEVYILSKEEGGRHTPFFNGYRPQFYIRTTDVTGILKLPEGVEMVMPGDNTPITGELITPVALEKGARFAIREGGRTVGAGTVTEILE